MKLISLKITPLSTFETPLSGDTIFGHILAYSFLNGEKIFKNYLNENPKLIVSDMFPINYLIKPSLPISYFKNKSNEEPNKKQLRKKNYIRFELLQQGHLNKCEKIDFGKDVEIIKNSINRNTFTTDSKNFAPYSCNEKNYQKELWMFMLIEENIINKILKILEDIGKYGYGKNSSTGKGQFKFEIIDNILSLDYTGYYMSISPTILKNETFENCWYEPITRFGKYGLNNSTNNPFKKPVIMANSGAIIKSNSKLNYFGSTINNGIKNKQSFIQGYSIAIPIKLKD